VAEYPQPLKGSKGTLKKIGRMENRMHAGAIKNLYQRAREFRNDMTHAETVLWGYLKTKPLGFKFRRQHPYSIYILDFYCHSLKLIVEVDGNIHQKPEVKLNDEQRQASLENDGLYILRFSNDLVEKKLEVVINEIENFIIKKKDEK
jgi:imidazole glycerol-phosphate synthase subunit HisF